MIHFFLFIISFIMLLTRSLCDILTLHYDRTSWRIIKDIVELPGLLGTQENDINTLTPYYTLIDYETNKPKDVVYYNYDRELPCYIIQNDFIVSDKVIPNMKIIKHRVKELNLYDGIGLGYHIEHNKTLSFIYQLNEQYHFDKFKFAIEDHYPKGQIHFGGIPNNTHLSCPYQTTIKVNESLTTWGFPLNQIIFNNTVYDVNMSAIIMISAPDMFIGDSFLNLMKNTIFKECLDETDSKNSLYCSEEVIKSMNTISFVFGNKKFEMKLENLFEFRRARISPSYGWWSRTFDEVVLGFEFVELFNYTMFDYDNKQVEFYGNKVQIIDLIDNNDNKTRIIFLSIIILCIINITQLGITKVKSNN